MNKDIQMKSHDLAGSAQQLTSKLLEMSPQTAQWLIGCYLYYTYQYSQPDDVNNISKNILTPFALCISTGIMCYTNRDTISNTACTLFNKGLERAKEFDTVAITNSASTLFNKGVQRAKELMNAKQNPVLEPKAPVNAPASKP
jgi:hypothetical protein